MYFDSPHAQSEDPTTLTATHIIDNKVINNLPAHFTVWFINCFKADTGQNVVLLYCTPGCHGCSKGFPIKTLGHQSHDYDIISMATTSKWWLTPGPTLQTWEPGYTSTLSGPPGGYLINSWLCGLWHSATMVSMLALCTIGHGFESCSSCFRKTSP